MNSQSLLLAMLLPIFSNTSSSTITALGGVLTAFDGEDSDQFGWGTAISGDGRVLAVGAYLWEGPVGSNRGCVYIYDWIDGAWVLRGEETLRASDAANTDQYGRGVALSADGSILAVGAHLWEGASGATDRGGVYIYDWNGSAWVQRGDVLEASDAAASDNYGWSVALSADGSILAVGAPLWEGTAGTDRGGVYIYDWNGSAWVQRGDVLTAFDAADSDGFGRHIALSADGSILAVGAPTWEGASGAADRGGVYIYDWDGSAWVQRGDVLEASDAAASDSFGYGVALSSSGSVLISGAPQWEGTAGTNRGGVYIYDWIEGAWTQRGGVLTAFDAANNDVFGRSVALSADGRILAVAANAWEGNVGTDRGGVYTYRIGSIRLTALPPTCDFSDGNNSQYMGWF